MSPISSPSSGELEHLRFAKYYRSGGAREVPFGKYAGRLIADLPGSSLHWFARKGFPAGEIGRLLALMREIDHNGLKPMLEPLRRRSGPGGSVREE